MRFTATAIAALFALGVGSAYAGSVTELTTDLTGHLDVNLDKTFDIEGTGGVDLTGISTTGAGEITVEVPASVDNAIEFSQGNWGDVSATKNYVSSGVEEVEASATAIANVAAIEVPGSLSLEASQINDGNVTSRANVTAWGADVVDVSSTAIANAISATVGGDAVFDISQFNEGHVTAKANVTATGVGEVTTAATAIGNVVSIELDGHAIGSIDQMNKGAITAYNSDRINAGFDPATATAIANAISITQQVAQ